MRIVCAHTGDHASEETRRALAGYEVTYVPMSGETDYHDLFDDLWADGQGWVNVEQDIVPWPGALEELMRCPEDWCAFGYPYGCPPFEHTGLGCAKFSSALLAAEPDVMIASALESTPIHPARHWCNMDDRIWRQLNARGYQRHVHGPAVGHLHTLPSHEPCGRCFCPIHAGR